MIRLLSPIIPFMYLESVADGMLKGLDQQRSTLFYNVADSLCRLTFIYLVVAKTGITGFILIMIVSNITTSSLNTGRLIKISGAGFDFFGWVLKPLAASLVGGAAGYLVTLWLGFGGALATLVSIGVQVGASVVMLFAMGCVKTYWLVGFLPKNKKFRKI